jgi:hypothetical protein
LEPSAGNVSALVTAQWLLVHKTVDDEPHAYDLYDSRGARLGIVRRADIPLEASMLRNVAHWIGWTSLLPIVRLEVVDMSGVPVFTVVFSAESKQFTAAVRDANGNHLGEVAKAKGLRKIHFDLRAREVTAGTIDATKWSGYDFRIYEGGVTVGRITTLGDRLVADIPTTNHDTLLELSRNLAEPLRTLVVACAVGMDVSVGPN